MKKTIVSLLLAVLLVVSIFSVTAFAEESYDVCIKGLHSAQINYAKLYTYTDGVKGETDLLAETSTVEDGWSLMYQIKLPAGDYWYEAYDSENYYNGGMKITVTEDGDNTFTIYRIYKIAATNSGWVEGVDYKISVTVTSPEGEERVIETGTANSWGDVNKSFLFMSGDTIEATLTPIGEHAESATAVTITEKPSMNDDMTAKIPQVIPVTINAPKGSTVSAGTFGNYYVYNFVEPEITETEDGVKAYFRMPETTLNHFYRVQNPDGVTYWNFAKWNAETEITVTEEDLYIGSEEFSKETVYRYEKNVYDRADIYLNANGKGYMDLDVGETFEFNVFRNWMAIESFMNAKVALPDMHYEVIDMEGNPSDILTIVPDENNSSVAKMTANKEGTAIVLVTYDAMTHMVGQGGTQFSAIWPECTGVVVVSVGADGSAIETNMMIDRLDAKSTAIDAEHDPLFYIGDEGASYSFTPESGCTVSVNRAVVNDELTYNGFTEEGVSVNSETGEVTVSGLTTGRNIVKIEKDGLATYQVITAREVSYVLQNAEGVEIDSTEVKPGDTIKLQFSNLVNPAEKLSGAYNFNASLRYVDENGTYFRSKPGSNFGVYDFSGNPVRQLIEITVPADWAESSYTLTGAIQMGGFGNTSVGGHRGVTYATGLEPNYNAPTVGMILGQLPKVVICLEHKTVKIEAVAATCTESGLTEGEKCSVCGEILVAQEVVEALGHDEVEHEAKEPTCTEIGWDAYVTCTRCDYTTYVEKEALGHDMADATCTEPASCKRCDHTEGEALGHDYGPWITVEEPTKTEGGRKVRTCKTCGQQTSKYIKPLGDDGITIIVPGEKYEGEQNPNTGAPVIGIVPFAVLAAAAIVFKKNNKK